MRAALGFAVVGLTAAGAAVMVSLLTSTERTFLIGDSFGADTAVAWGVTVAAIGFLGAFLAALIGRRWPDGRTGPALFLVLALLPLGALMVAISWFGVDRYTVSPFGTVTREQPGFLQGEQLYYRRDGILLTLTDRWP